MAHARSSTALPAGTTAGSVITAFVGGAIIALIGTPWAS